MVFGEILFYILIAIIGIGLLALLLLPKIKNLKTFYKIRVVILTPGCNIHKEIKPESLPHKVEIKTDNESKEYTVTVENLWKLKHTFLKRPWYWLTGVKGRYICIFRASEGGQSIKNVEAQATPVLIRSVKRSKILGKALAEIFKAGFGGFGRFIIIMIAVGILLYFAYQNGLIG